MASSAQISSSSDDSAATVVADRLRIPWAIAFLPSGDMLVTERAGTLLRIGSEGTVRNPIEGVLHQGEGGLLGIALHPDFTDNRWVYLYLTTSKQGEVRNRVERYVLGANSLTDRTAIISDIPGAIYHDGGALAFGPDRYLYITTGDAGNPALAQDTNSLAGKILRVDEHGAAPSSNPFGNAVYSYGHRNPQGLAWDTGGNLWSTEHGRSGAFSGFDELNLIKPGRNYGWPDIQGSETETGKEAPVLHSGSDTTWAPASAAFLHGSIFFGGLRGEALYEAKLRDVGRPELVVHFSKAFGRIRAVTVGPGGFLYISTSNTDGRGAPGASDDRILRIDPSKLKSV